ncbi:hotdog domain-containing protein [Bradymonas sediminis]|uniref:Thioesterase n=1 Tax=Bradymonas sediminis TaxID=1548548 RepID=A0A2Z4FM28_9DELT|nr:hotdog domain-containing protein [Bradymonas sediminis]AWV89728.1 thioesterase [Bradymonas sediminis]TDP76528.1 acyl-coenzyme A thioesterase PaaI-like protein [Bradymonas sediminis]
MNEQPRTHLEINPELCGEVVALAVGRAQVELVATSVMAADERGLVHGGFVFGLADYAAMLAVNDPNVVLGAAEARFLAPVTVGQKIIAYAEVEEEAGKKRRVEAYAKVGDVEVFRAKFTAFVLEKHVLDQ